MTDLPKRALPPWAAKLVTRENGTGAVPLAPYAGSLTAQRVDPSVRETEMGPVPSITDAERADRHGMAAITKRGEIKGEP